ncbi:type I restriction-modification system specificity subunit [Caldibacillus thermoamylovorans]|uniref:Type I restriction-modification system specificity subunit n=1 Tax=Caldibacillus thermoamylovorans TaxID=35841 RepID=A0A090IYA9_9BACI|nr:restriction endonuclease subunit S [Caldibacillus thermoamylovorans]CEE00530.1 type I restriction-modification system specificity subunit [Caldibacillus thermoamylovorans]
MISKYKIYPLKKFIKQIRGVSYKKDQISEKPIKDFIPLLRATNIQNGELTFEDLLYVEPSLVKDEQKFKKGDILIAASSGSKEVVGKPGQVKEDGNYTFGAFCKLIRPNNNIIPDYLRHFFNTDYYSQTISHTINGANINNLRNEHIDNLLIPLPSLEIQRKIAVLLNKAQNLMDCRKAQIEALDQLTQSVFLEMFGDPVKNPLKWDIVRLEQIGEWKSGGTPSRSNKEYFKGRIPWLSAGELNSIFTYSSNEHINEEALENSAAKLIEKDSLLLGMYDTAALKSTINKVECACNQAVAFAKLDRSIVNTIFVYYCIQIGKSYYKRLQRGVRQKNMNLTMIKNIQIICPKIELQREFANVVENVLEQKEKLEKGLIELENNFNSLMQRAFNGELFTDEKVSNR